MISTSKQRSKGPPGPWLTLNLLFFVMTVTTSGCARKKPDPMTRLAPAGISGFKSASSARTFDRKTVFKQLNGGAEVYLDYGFKKLLMREYTRPRSPKITLYIFDMGSAENAYGIFSHELEGAEIDIGQGSDYAAGLLRFWRGKYFVSVFAPRENRPVKKAILNLGKSVAGRIKHPGKKPAMVSYLPGQSLEPRSIRFLHTHQTLAHHIDLGSANVLGLDRRTDVVVAEYSAAPSLPKLSALVVSYPNADQASQALDRLNELDGASPAQVHRTPPGQRRLARSCGRVLVAVFGPAGPALPLFRQLVQKTPECKNERQTRK